jgi:hypothetical protein
LRPENHRRAALCVQLELPQFHRRSLGDEQRRDAVLTAVGRVVTEPVLVQLVYRDEVLDHVLVPQTLGVDLVRCQTLHRHLTLIARKALHARMTTPPK